MKNQLLSCAMTFILSVLMSTTVWGQQNEPNKNKTDENSILVKLAADTSQFSIKVFGSTNCVKVNGKIMTSTTDSTNTNNKISVSGEGNTVSVIQSERKSDVNIKQEGAHNQAIISQRK